MSLILTLSLSPKFCLKAAGYSYALMGTIMGGW